MRQRFRANLETASCPAFWEDQQFGAPGETMTFRVGAAKLIGTNSCKRCVVPTRDPSGAGELTVPLGNRKPRSSAGASPAHYP